MSEVTASALAALCDRPRWGPEDARQVLLGWQSSGLSLAEFARRHRLQAVRLQRWRARLGEPEAVPMFFHRVEVNDPTPVTEAPSLVLILRSNHRLEIGEGVDPATLVSVIRTVEGGGC